MLVLCLRKSSGIVNCAIKYEQLSMKHAIPRPPPKKIEAIDLGYLIFGWTHEKSRNFKWRSRKWELLEQVDEG